MPDVISTCSKCGAKFGWNTDAFAEGPLCPQCGYDTLYGGKRNVTRVAGPPGSAPSPSAAGASARASGQPLQVTRLRRPEEPASPPGALPVARLVEPVGTSNRWVLPLALGCAGIVLLIALAAGTFWYVGYRVRVKTKMREAQLRALYQDSLAKSEQARQAGRDLEKYGAPLDGLGSWMRSRIATGETLAELRRMISQPERKVQVEDLRFQTAWQMKPNAAARLAMLELRGKTSGASAEEAILGLVNQVKSSALFKEVQVKGFSLDEASRDRSGRRFVITGIFPEAVLAPAPSTATRVTDNPLRAPELAGPASSTRRPPQERELARLEAEVATLRREIEQLPRLDLQLNECLRQLRDLQSQILRPRLGGNYILSATEYVEEAARTANIAVQPLREIGRLDAPGNGSPAAWRLYEVRLSLTGTYHDVEALAGALESTSPCFRISGLTLTGRPDSPEKHLATLTLQWPIWAEDFGAELAARTAGLPAGVPASDASPAKPSAAARTRPGENLARPPDDPFWPVGYDRNSPALTGRRPGTGAAGQDATDAPQHFPWPELRVKAVTKTLRGEYLAIIDGIGMVKTGETVKLTRDGIRYRWRIGAISEKGASFVKVDAVPVK